MTRSGLTPAEQAIYDAGWRAGVQTVLDYASRSAAAIEPTSKRHVHEGFAVAAARVGGGVRRAAEARGRSAEGRMSLVVEQPMSLNRRIKEMKLNLKALTQRAEEAELDLAKAEAALRNMTISHAKEKARADRAEAQLRSLGARVGVAA